MKQNNTLSLQNYNKLVRLNKNCRISLALRLNSGKHSRHCLKESKTHFRFKVKIHLKITLKGSKKTGPKY